MTDTHLASSEALEEVGLAASVHAEQPVPAANGKLDRAVLDELGTGEAHREPERGESDVETARMRRDGCLMEPPFMHQVAMHRTVKKFEHMQTPS